MSIVLLQVCLVKWFLLSKTYTIAGYVWKFLVMEIKLQYNWKLENYLQYHLCIYYEAFLECQHYRKNWSKRSNELLLIQLNDSQIHLNCFSDRRLEHRSFFTIRVRKGNTPYVILETKVLMRSVLEKNH